MSLSKTDILSCHSFKVPVTNISICSMPVISALNWKMHSLDECKSDHLLVSCVQGQLLTPGVIYVGHLPLGLFEPQLKTYFEQFGKVLRLRLSRSKKVRDQSVTCVYLLNMHSIWNFLFLSTLLSFLLYTHYIKLCLNFRPSLKKTKMSDLKFGVFPLKFGSDWKWSQM